MSEIDKGYVHTFSNTPKIRHLLDWEVEGGPMSVDCDV
jgi:hypothetical protein